MRAARRASPAIAALAIVLIAAPAPAEGPRPVHVRAAPVEIGPATLSGAGILGAWELSAPGRDFGGFSGLVAGGTRLVAVTDMGVLLEAALDREGSVLAFRDARLLPLREGDGSRPGKAGGDAEALTVVGGQLFAAFERDHRLAPLGPDGIIGEPLTFPALERLPSNGGIEALATVGDVLLAIPETREGDGFPVFAVSSGGNLLATGRVAADPPHLVTGADFGPDGRLYVVLRDFSLLAGVSIRVRRYDLAGSPPLPVAGSGETLAAFERTSGIDNMEAISVWQDDDGRLRLWLLSDDNFNPLQRTLLLDLALDR